jgi:hypothetical protein
MSAGICEVRQDRVDNGLNSTALKYGTRENPGMREGKHLSFRNFL